MIFYEISIADLPTSVSDALEINNFITVILRWIGYAIYSFISGILNFCEEAFTVVLKFDFMKIEAFSGFEEQAKPLLLSVMFLAFLLVVGINFLKARSQLKLIYNVAMIVLGITAFSSFTGLVMDLRNAGINEVDRILLKETNEAIGDRLFRANTYDMKRSAENGDLETIDETIPIGDYFVSATLEEDLIPDKWVIVDGELTTEFLNNGFFDAIFGSEAYLAYSVDYVALNCTAAIMAIVYLFGIFKLWTLSWEFLLVCLEGRVIVSASMDDSRRVSMIYTTALKNGLGFIFVYFVMVIYSILVDAMFKNQLTENWLANCMMLLVGSAFVLLGGDNMMRSLGINGGDSGLVRSGALIFGASRVARLGRKVRIGGRPANNPSISRDEKETSKEADQEPEEEKEDPQARDTSYYTDFNQNHHSSSEAAASPSLLEERTNFKPTSISAQPTPPLIPLKETASDPNDRQLQQLSTHSEGNKPEKERNIYSEHGMKELIEKQDERAQSIQKKLTEPNRKLKLGDQWYVANDGQYFTESRDPSGKLNRRTVPNWYMQQKLTKELEKRSLIDGHRKTIYDDELSERLQKLKAAEEPTSSSMPNQELQALLNELRGEQDAGDTEKDENKEQRIWDF